MEKKLLLLSTESDEEEQSNANDLTHLFRLLLACSLLRCCGGSVPAESHQLVDKLCLWLDGVEQERSSQRRDASIEVVHAGDCGRDLGRVTVALLLARHERELRNHTQQLDHADAALWPARLLHEVCSGEHANQVGHASARGEPATPAAAALLQLLVDDGLHDLQGVEELEHRSWVERSVPGRSCLRSRAGAVAEVTHHLPVGGEQHEEVPGALRNAGAHVEHGEQLLEELRAREDLPWCHLNSCRDALPLDSSVHGLTLCVGSGRGLPTLVALAHCSDDAEVVLDAHLRYRLLHDLQLLAEGEDANA
mmetsp:Transcript_15005/g.58765  ORF Transcript_15005/g.58765 Transcript_15005/m.58765 type:complete len:308 (+) Transcript_15005:5373-6296(+)